MCITEEEREKIERILKRLDEIKITPEMIEDGQRLVRELGRMTPDDFFRPFDI